MSRPTGPWELANPFNSFEKPCAARGSHFKSTYNRFIGKSPSPFLWTLIGCDSEFQFLGPRFYQHCKITDIFQLTDVRSGKFHMEFLLYRQYQANMSQAIPTVDVFGRKLRRNFD